MKVAELATDVGYMGLPADPVRTLSIENKGATRSPAATADNSAPYDKDRLKTAMKAADKLTAMSNKRLKFEYREEADVYQVTVIDENDEVVRKIPADSILSVIENIERMLGLSIDTKA
jgi:flagellar protein FlaG